MNKCEKTWSDVTDQVDGWGDALDTRLVKDALWWHRDKPMSVEDAKSEIMATIWNTMTTERKRKFLDSIPGVKWEVTQ